MSTSDNVYVLSDAGLNADLQTPTDPATLSPGEPPRVIWPAPRNAKIDTAVILKNKLTELGVTDEMCVIVTNGAFHVSMMVSEEFHERVVIVLNRTSDSARRMALGEQIGTYTAHSIETGELIDIDNALADVGLDTIVLKNQVSDVTLDIWIFDENAQRIEQVYLLVKAIMQTAEKTFMEVLGYLECLRVNGSDTAQLADTAQGGVFPVYERVLQYRMTHLDFVAGIEGVANLIQQTFTVADASGVATTATESTNIGGGP